MIFYYSNILAAGELLIKSLTLKEHFIVLVNLRVIFVNELSVTGPHDQILRE